MLGGDSASEHPALDRAAIGSKSRPDRSWKGNGLDPTLRDPERAATARVRRGIEPNDPGRDHARPLVAGGV